MNITVLHEFWRPHPLCWIHRAEATSITKELLRQGHAVRLTALRGNFVTDSGPGPLLLRVSDPVMLTATQALTRAGKSYLGPGALVMQRCYDKYEAQRLATAQGVDCPQTALASESNLMPFPLVLKPRRGSDSMGLRLFNSGPISARLRTDRYIAQEYIRGAELSIAVFRGKVGAPLRIILPEGKPYSFLRKYLIRPVRERLADSALAERVRHRALEIAGVFGVDWAARIDLMHETVSDRLRLLECDAAPLIGAKSTFAASFSAAGIDRAEQLKMLLGVTDEKYRTG